MAIDDLQAEIEKLKYQVGLLGDTVDFREHPIASLAIEMDWGRKDLDAAHDIFEQARAVLDRGEDPDFSGFEQQLERRFKITYQGIKPIILAFYRNHQWGDVCEWYVKKQMSPGAPAEFREIVEEIGRRESGSQE